MRKPGLPFSVFLPAFLAIACTAVPGASSGPDATADAADPSRATTVVVPGCSVPALPGDSPADPAEVVGLRGSPNYPPILTLGTKVDSLADAKVSAMAPVELRRLPDGLPVQAVLFDGDRDADERDGKLNPMITTVYAKAALQPDDTILDVLGGGGGIFQQAVSAGVDAALVKETIGDYATLIKIGDIDAALVESSTWPGDFRSHALYWSDGRLDFSLIIGGSSAEVVKVGQSLYCGITR